MFRRYQVNLLVDHGDTTGPPSCYEDHADPAEPARHGSSTRAQLGALVTDFTLIRAGRAPSRQRRLPRARRTTPAHPAARLGSAQARAPCATQIRIESLGRSPRPVARCRSSPSRSRSTPRSCSSATGCIYYLLSEHDPDFLRALQGRRWTSRRRSPRLPDSELRFARLFGTIASAGRAPTARSPRPPRRWSSTRSRLTGDARASSPRTCAASRTCFARPTTTRAAPGGDLVAREDVAGAIAAQRRRATGSASDSSRRSSAARSCVIDTERRAGRVRSTACRSSRWARFRFGRPTRITARVRLGDGEVVDIEREVQLGGPIHSKGVLILAGLPRRPRTPPTVR